MNPDLSKGKGQPASALIQNRWSLLYTIWDSFPIAGVCIHCAHQLVEATACGDRVLYTQRGNQFEDGREFWIDRVGHCDVFSMMGSVDLYAANNYSVRGQFMGSILLSVLVAQTSIDPAV